MTVYAHIFVDQKRKGNRIMNHIPRVGDTVRVSETTYGKVYEVVWCFDETNPIGERVNIGIETEK